VGKYAVTFDDWDVCVRDGGCAYNPGDEGWGRGRRPVINVSWNDAQEYIQWLSAKTGKTYRLLSEAEWEYAARAGSSTSFHTGANINPTQANYDTSKSFAGSATAPHKRQTAPVGSYQPNQFGLYDVHGNVWEWTEDCWNGNCNGAPTQGEAWTSGDCGRRVLRGGSWYVDPQVLRSASRDRSTVEDRNYVIGFRVARTL
jgi:formylglycine-generating enzyme required for sulfatase activity